MLEDNEPDGVAFNPLPNNDMVNSPNHYTSGGIETIEYLKAKLSREEFLGFLRGNALKYLSRMGKKDAQKIDAEKAAWYTKRLSEEI